MCTGFIVSGGGGGGLWGDGFNIVLIIKVLFLVSFYQFFLLILIL